MNVCLALNESLPLQGTIDLNDIHVTSSNNLINFIKFIY
jgi:hypothetical protein